MKRKLVYGLICCLMLGSIPIEAMAYSVPETVRVGLESVCKNTSSAAIATKELLIGTEKDGNFKKGGTVFSQNGFSVRIAVGNYIAVDEEMNLDDALDMAATLTKRGHEATAAYTGGKSWTVYVKNATVGDVESAAKASAARVQNFEGYLLSGGNSNVIIPEDAVLMGTDTEDTIAVNGKSYRGMLTFAVSGSTMTAVNVVPLEEYLYGVVPAEMPASYEQEALKAQAVAARTYAMTKLGAHTGSGYQLCDTTACQVYKGYSGEMASATKAVNATAGEVLCYHGEPIEAVFSASSGGYTENSEDVWNTAVPYLRAVPEIAEYDNNSWTRTLTLSELNALLAAKGEKIGSAKDIVITKLSTGGRVQEMQIVGTSGTKTLTKEDIRTYFSSAFGSLPGKMFTINGKGGESSGNDAVTQNNAPKSNSLLAAAAKNGITAKTTGTLSALNGKKLSVEVKQSSATPSRTDYYAVYSVSISTVKDGKFVFNGNGSGHGVGMSQKGAQGMAQLGYSYDNILKHYYTDVTIEG